MATVNSIQRSPVLSVRLYSTLYVVSSIVLGFLFLSAKDVGEFETCRGPLCNAVSVHNTKVALPFVTNFDITKNNFQGVLKCKLLFRTRAPAIMPSLYK